MTRIGPFLARRLLFAILLVLVVSSGALVLSRLAPGDIATDLVGRGLTQHSIEVERARLGLDRSIASQYLDWLKHALGLNLGTSLLYGRPVIELVAERAANSALLGAVALLVATLIGVPLGVLAATQPLSKLALVIRGCSVAGVSVPPLLTSLMFALLAARTGWFPVGGLQSLDAETLGPIDRLWDTARHLVLPALALALPVAATLEQLQSRAMADALRAPYVVAARARGISGARLLWRDTLRVAIKPVLSVYGMIVGGLLSGSFAVEIVMSWPGLGRLMYDALLARDVYLVAGCAAAGAVFLAAATMLADMSLLIADPRLREEA